MWCFGITKLINIGKPFFIWGLIRQSSGAGGRSWAWESSGRISWGWLVRHVSPEVEGRMERGHWGVGKWILADFNWNAKTESTVLLGWHHLFRVRLPRFNLPSLPLGLRMGLYLACVPISQNEPKSFIEWGALDSFLRSHFFQGISFHAFLILQNANSLKVHSQQESGLHRTVTLQMKV
jgi:hypothetical protein